MSDTVNRDEEHLRLLSVFHYVVAGLAALFGCFPVIHLVIGILMLSGVMDDSFDDHRADHEDADIIWVVPEGGDKPELDIKVPEAVAEDIEEAVPPPPEPRDASTEEAAPGTPDEPPRHVAADVAEECEPVPWPRKGPHGPPMKFFGAIFVAFAAIYILCAWTLAGLIAIAGRCLSRRTHYTYCFVIAGICCIFIPFGTILGVFTIIVLARPSVKALFEPGDVALTPL